MQIILDELRAFRTEMREELSNAKEKAHDAHRRIDKYENRLVGWFAGAAVGGGGLGAFLAKWLS